MLNRGPSSCSECSNGGFKVNKFVDSFFFKTKLILEHLLLFPNLVQFLLEVLKHRRNFIFHANFAFYFILFRFISFTIRTTFYVLELDNFFFARFKYRIALEHTTPA